MKKLADLIAVTCFSVAALTSFHLIPELFPNDDLNSIIQYGVMAGAFIYFIWAYELPTMQYFRLPALSVPSFFGLLVAVFYSYSGISGSDGYTLPLLPTITGIFYLYTLGLGEEVVSRGFVFGVFTKHGTALALVVSSITFGLMHLNLYLGEYWNPVEAYWHVLGASSFGFMAAAVMLATKSILPPIILHALYDWPVIFSAPPEDNPSDYISKFDPLWQTIKDSFAHIGPDMAFGLFLLFVIWVGKIRKVPRFLYRPLKFFGLVERED